ncbi:MAG: Gfo/Idh/MocA family oxidoreductase [Proteobacteria bacterium]|nr:Gfo/Idh/MocA family oxidoreductase [Pseudomonadota bacterium]
MEKTSENLPKIAVVGLGHWGKNHIRTAHALGALGAVHDADAALAARFAADTRTKAPGWPAILADASIEGVILATPAGTHAALARAALDAGKHVLVEKPLALSPADANEVVAHARRVGRTLMVGHLLRYHSAFEALSALVRRGELGRLQYVASNRLNLGKVRREEDILWSFAPHDISMILDLAGEMPNGVTAIGAPVLHAVIADVTTTHLSFPSGMKAHVYVSWLNPTKEQKLTVVGEKGMAVFDDGQPWDRKLVLYRHRIDWVDGKPEPARADAESVALTQSEPLKAEIAHFLDCIAGRRATPITDGAEGLRVLRVLDAAARSMRSGAPVRLDPESAAAPSAPGAFVHESAYVDAPVELGEGVKIWHFSHVLPRTRIGAGTVLGQNVVAGPDVAIGANCKIQNNVSIYKGVTLEDGVFCGPSCVFTNVLTPRAEIERKNEFAPTLVKRGATIGANATIVCGHTVGAYATIAAGAVVTKDVPDHALVAGVPARRIGWVSRTGERLGPDLVCPRTGERYRQIGLDKLEIAK